MNTTATNRKVRVLLSDLKDGRLVSQPIFQRRLVWATKHKQAFIDTILKGYPFPEIYVAAGAVDPESGQGIELLVDGQQRVATIQQYFDRSPDLRLGQIPPYDALSEDEKRSFLEYVVVVRDLGPLPMPEIKEVFRRINSTSYALNTMELHNASFDGRFKEFGEKVASHPFFEHHRVFRATEIRRMQDLRFALTLVTTLLSTYFNRDDELEDYLQRYNDDFPHESKIWRRLLRVFRTIDSMKLPPSSRAWQKADLLTLLVEVDRALQGGKVKSKQLAEVLTDFYRHVDSASKGPDTPRSAREYYMATLQASNDRISRVTRGAILASVFAGESAG